MGRSRIVQLNQVSLLLNEAGEVLTEHPGTATAPPRTRALMALALVGDRPGQKSLHYYGARELLKGVEDLGAAASAEEYLTEAIEASETRR